MEVKKLKRKIFSVLLALVLVLSFGLVTAVPAGAQEEMPDAIVFPFELGGKAEGNYVAEWEYTEVHTGSSSVHLATAGDVGTGNEARIRIDFSTFPEGDRPTLGEIESISWYEYLVEGYPPHIDIYLDIDGDGTADDALVIEYAYNDEVHCASGWPTYGAVTGAWYQTFNDDGDGPAEIDDTANAWLNSGPPGPLGGEDFIYGTLAEWKLGEVVGGEAIDGDTVVLAFEIEVDNWIAQTEAYVDDIYITGVGQPPMLFSGQIQDAVDTVDSDDLIVVMPGTYDEQVVINKDLMLIGSGDATVIQPSGPELAATTSIPWLGGGTGTMSAIVSVETTGAEVTIRDLEIDGSLITTKSTTWVGGLVYLETGGLVEGVTVNGGSTLPDRTAGIFAAAITNPASLEVTGCTVEVYTRAGIYALGGEFTADYHHNEINGPAGAILTGVPNGMFFLEGANGSATYNTVTDLAYTGEGEYRSTGIGTYNAGTNVTFSYNEISNVQNAFALSTGTIGTIVEYNETYNCHTGVRIEANAASSVIQYNDIHDNDFAIRCGATMGDGNEAHYNNFVDNPGLEWTNSDEAVPNTYVGAVCNLHQTYGLDAGMNWWGDISGPTVDGEGQYYSGADSDKVGGDVNFVPWLTRDFQTVLDDNIAYFGFPMVQLNTGWNTLSTPIALDPGCDEWDEYVALGDGLAIHDTSPAYAFNGAIQDWLPLIGEDADYRLKPCDAIYVRMAEPDIGAILQSPDVSVASKDLYAGWNLVGFARFPDGRPCREAWRVLRTVEEVTGDLMGWELVVNPPSNWYVDNWHNYWRTSEMSEEECLAFCAQMCMGQEPDCIFFCMDMCMSGGEGEAPPMCVTLGYWVFMQNDGTLAGLSSTPVPLPVD